METSSILPPSPSPNFRTGKSGLKSPIGNNPFHLGDRGFLTILVAKRP